MRMEVGWGVKGLGPTPRKQLGKAMALDPVLIPCLPPVPLKQGSETAAVTQQTWTQTNLGTSKLEFLTEKGILCEPPGIIAPKPVLSTYILLLFSPPSQILLSCLSHPIPTAAYPSDTFFFLPASSLHLLTPLFPLLLLLPPVPLHSIPPSLQSLFSLSFPLYLLLAPAHS